MSLLLLLRPGHVEAAVPPQPQQGGRLRYAGWQQPPPVVVPDPALADDEEVLATLSTHHPNPLRPH